MHAAIVYQQDLWLVAFPEKKTNNSLKEMWHLLQVSCILLNHLTAGVSSVLGPIFSNVTHLDILAILTGALTVKWKTEIL